jgi:hypothetical protein
MKIFFIWGCKITKIEFDLIFQKYIKSHYIPYLSSYFNDENISDEKILNFYLCNEMWRSQ